MAGVATVGFLFGPLGGLDDHDFPAGMVLEHGHQPGVHAADFKDGEKTAFRPGLLGKIVKKRADPLPLRAHLPLEDHRSVFAAHIHRQLPLVLVDTEV